ncbi:BlaI/MecI/CopY family transcriptional regulator [Gimesia fumaroli]|uniref:Penicillinase repressor n=1 Tax=Gimesia fumaroli TaxID=2527976 RepID=A0A518IFD0_9PLAN|nr:BlaI/MecI/CopY family transcriptional regulator [Gimesia fumaroli]QDV51795.1 Penicillinase repressor [Gimesia fumaroli]
MNAKQLGRVQLQIMQVLWDRGRANAREITDTLNESSEIAHSTVQTLLRQLEAKQAIAHDVEERTFVFYPLIKEDKVTRQATRELINKIFDGSASGLVAYLLENEKIPKSELQRLRKLINDES